MKEICRVEVGVPIEALTRVNRTVVGSNGGDLYEVDTLHNTTFKTPISTYPITVKQLHNMFHTGLYICNQANLHTLSGCRLLNFC